MKDDTPNICELVADGDFRRDAVHVAIAPVTAAEFLEPGQHVGYVSEDQDGFGWSSDKPIGCVSPFLTRGVEVGERFWLMLYPGSVERLSHLWSSSKFRSPSVKKTKVNTGLLSSAFGQAVHEMFKLETSCLTDGAHQE